jgi:multiple sugar transport system permease protein
MTQASLTGGPEPATARAAVVTAPARPFTRGRWWRTYTAQRLTFGYLLLAPAALYVLLLVGAPFLFSLYLAVSDANVGDPVARFIGFENFASALEMEVFWTALQNSVVFLVVAAIFKSLLGTTLAFLLLQDFRGKKIVRGLVVIPFTLPIAISVLAWKWMYDSQFSVINWVLSRLGLIGQFGTESWPVWLGDPHLALAACIAVNVWRTFPFSAIVLLAGFTSVPLEVLDAAKVDGCTFFQRFRHVVVPMIFPILMIGFLFDTVFTLSDLSVVYLLTQGGPGNATKILPVLAYQVGIQAGNLGRGAAIALFLVPLLAPLMFLFLRNLKRREY